MSTNNLEIVQHVVLIPVNLIHRDPNQPRTVFDPVEMAMLKKSLTDDGLIEPIHVRPHPKHAGHFIVHTGERRFRAHVELGLIEIKAVIREDLEGSAFRLQVSENMIREDMTPLDEARAMRELLDGADLKEGQSRTLQEVGNITGRTDPTIIERLLLLELPKEIQVFLNENRIKYGAAVELARLKQRMDDQMLLSLAEDVIAKRLSVRELQEIRGESKSSRGKKRGKSRVPKTGSAQLRRLIHLRQQVPAKLALILAFLELSEKEQRKAWKKIHPEAQKLLLRDLPKLAKGLNSIVRRLKEITTTDTVTPTINRRQIDPKRPKRKETRRASPPVARHRTVPLQSHIHTDGVVEFLAAKILLGAILDDARFLDVARIQSAMRREDSRLPERFLTPQGMITSLRLIEEVWVNVRENGNLMQTRLCRDIETVRDITKTHSFQGLMKKLEAADKSTLFGEGRLDLSSFV